MADNCECHAELRGDGQLTSLMHKTLSGRLHPEGLRVAFVSAVWLIIVSASVRNATFVATSTNRFLGDSRLGAVRCNYVDDHPSFSKTQY